MAIIDVVAWSGRDYNDQLYAWRFPETELSTWTQLLVNESQEAVLYRSGALDGPFGPGRHVLKTENIPILRSLLNLPFGRSPFTAEVWFVNKSMPLDVKWGTREPILLKDPQYHIMIPVVARGQYGIQIENSRKFLIKLVGAMPEFTREKLQSYFRGLILTVAKSVISREIVRKQVSILEIGAQLDDLSAAIQAALRESLEDFGLRLVNFYVSGIDVQEGDASLETLRSALAKRAEMSIVGYTYQQERSLNALEGAAGFTAADRGLESGGNNIAAAAMGLGVGLGAGAPIGGALGTQMAQVVTPQLAAQAAPPPLMVAPTGILSCPKCQASVTATARFCPSCGNSMAPPTAPCTGCGAPLTPGAAFCAQCGASAQAACRQCGAKLALSARFCGECGTPRSPGPAGGTP